RYNLTRNWHFVDIELRAPDFDRACFGHPPIPAGAVASLGPANDCVVDKINQFTAELSAPGTADAERLLALTFLLHFLGDLHQPLHAREQHDAGGNQKNLTAAGLHAGTLHRYWDTSFVEQLGSNPVDVADALVAKITKAQIQQWSIGSAKDWAKQ